MNRLAAGCSEINDERGGIAVIEGDGLIILNYRINIQFQQIR
jgi:hypothetical protein